MNQDAPQTDRTAATAPTTAELDITRTTGTWRIASTSATVYYVDLDQHAVLRVRPPGHGSFTLDNLWAPLVSIESLNLTTRAFTPSVIRVGERPRYTFDPGPHWPDHEWRIQRVVTTIDPVTPDEAIALHTTYASALPR